MTVGELKKILECLDDELFLESMEGKQYSYVALFLDKKYEYVCLCLE